MSSQRMNGTECERVGRLIVDAELNEVAMDVLEDAISQSVGFDAERQTAMRIDVFRSVESEFEHD